MLKTTESGTKIEMVEFITGGQGRKLGILAGVNPTPEQQESMQDAMIEVCVKSVNDNKEDIVEAVKNLSLADYMEVLNFCTELFTGLTEQKKTI